MSKLTKHEIQYLIKECRRNQGISRHDIVGVFKLDKVDVYNLENKLTGMLIELGELGGQK